MDFKEGTYHWCKQGQSANQPFFDGTHFPAGCKDGDPSIQSYVNKQIGCRVSHETKQP